MGLCLWGIVEEPPAARQPSVSPLADLTLHEQADVARHFCRSSRVTTAQAHSRFARWSRCVCHGASGQVSPRSEASASPPRVLDLRATARVPTAPPSCSRQGIPECAVEIVPAAPNCGTPACGFQTECDRRCGLYRSGKRDVFLCFSESACNPRSARDRCPRSKPAPASARGPSPCLKRPGWLRPVYEVPRLFVLGPHK